jgi:hypothetical protein
VKAYTPASSKAWGNSSVNYGKPTSKAKEIVDHINSLEDGSRIVASRLMEISGSPRSGKMYDMLRVLSGQGMVKSTTSTHGLRKWYKKRNLTEKEVFEASQYII